MIYCLKFVKNRARKTQTSFSPCFVYSTIYVLAEIYDSVFAKLFHGLVDASRRKTRHRADSCRRDRICCRKFRHASVHGYKAQHEASATTDDRNIFIIKRCSFCARTNQIAQNCNRGHGTNTKNRNIHKINLPLLSYIKLSNRVIHSQHMF